MKNRSFSLSVAWCLLEPKALPFFWLAALLLDLPCRCLPPLRYIKRFLAETQCAYFYFIFSHFYSSFLKPHAHSFSVHLHLGNSTRVTSRCIGVPERPAGDGWNSSRLHHQFCVYWSQPRMEARLTFFFVCLFICFFKKYCNEQTNKQQQHKQTHEQRTHKLLLW